MILETSGRLIDVLAYFMLGDFGVLGEGLAILRRFSGCILGVEEGLWLVFGVFYRAVGC